MSVFWKLSGIWINTDHVIAVREMRGRGDAPSKYKIILDGNLGELPGEIICEGADARELLRLLEPDPAAWATTSPQKATSLRAD